MIGRLSGKLLECSPERVLLDVGGVGYDVRIPLSTYYALNERSAPSCMLLIHTHVREEALQLFGFASLPERSAFEKLIRISGVGPRMALAVLSGIGVDDLCQAVAAKDLGRLQKIPGVGRKTAERVMFELENKLSTGGADGPGGQFGAAPGDSPPDDARSALVNLGYSVDAARRAVSAAIEELGREAALEPVLKAALARLAR